MEGTVRILGRMATVVLGAAVVLLSGAGLAQAEADPPLRGVIFVHGYFGSGAQFESQALRLEGNGYPIGHVRTLEYDSTFATESQERVYEKLDRLIAEVKRHTGQPQVDVLGHSRGTTVMQGYLRSSPERAADVAHYVNIDGRQSSDPPGGVPTLALWAGREDEPGEPRRSIGGAKNVYLEDQAHVQAATSEEAFAAFYQFFRGERPRTIKVVPTPGRITLAGRALLFPQNRHLTGQRVELWPIDAATGRRTSDEPDAVARIDGNGDWGPVSAQAGRRYELTLIRPGLFTLHFYYEPFLRSDHQIRLLYSEALEAALQPRTELSTGILVLRYKEFWGDQGDDNDVLEVNGLNICNAVICPLAGNVIGIFAYDYNGDLQTDLSKPNPLFSELPFLAGADVFLPASRPPTGTHTVTLRARGGGPARSLRFPAYPSTTDEASLYFNDFEQPTDLDRYPLDERLELGLFHERSPISIRGGDENIGCRARDAVDLRLTRCTVTVEAAVRGEDRPTVLGRGEREQDDRRSFKVPVTLTSAGRALLRRRPEGFRATIVARGTEAFGRTSTVRERVTFRRSR